MKVKYYRGENKLSHCISLNIEHSFLVWKLSSKILSWDRKMRKEEGSFAILSSFLCTFSWFIVWRFYTHGKINVWSSTLVNIFLRIKIPVRKPCQGIWQFCVDFSVKLSQLANFVNQAPFFPHTDLFVRAFIISKSSLSRTDTNIHWRWYFE